MIPEESRKGLTIRFAHNVKRYRLRQGITQLDLAAKTGTSVRFIVYIENGERMPKADLAYVIAKALGVTVDDLFAPYTSK